VQQGGAGRKDMGHDRARSRETDGGRMGVSPMVGGGGGGGRGGKVDAARGIKAQGRAERFTREHSGEGGARRGAGAHQHEDGRVGDQLHADGDAAGRTVRTGALREH
jgi:hypothetical protein